MQEKINSYKHGIALELRYKVKEKNIDKIESDIESALLQECMRRKMHFDAEIYTVFGFDMDKAMSQIVRTIKPITSLFVGMTIHLLNGSNSYLNETDVIEYEGQIRRLLGFFRDSVKFSISGDSKNHESKIEVLEYYAMIITQLVDVLYTNGIHIEDTTFLQKHIDFTLEFIRNQQKDIRTELEKINLQLSIEMSNLEKEKKEDISSFLRYMAYLGVWRFLYDKHHAMKMSDFTKSLARIIGIIDNTKLKTLETYIKQVTDYNEGNGPLASKTKIQPEVLRLENDGWDINYISKTGFWK